MTMASNAYKVQKNNEDKIVDILISGFIGSLKGWWDNYVTESDKQMILKAKKTIVKIENNVQIPTQEDDMVNYAYDWLKCVAHDPRDEIDGYEAVWIEGTRLKELDAL
nr:putative reverse transcriptase domain, zinc finger, CCHC-type, aspartic peptidase domain protein [Tanacetum cinerariifolium]